MYQTGRLSFILFFTLITSFALQANQELDSILISRNHQLSDYYRFKDGMKERTWINLVDLNSRGLQLIETDNLVLNNYLEFEMNKVNDLNDKLEKANLEILLFNREIELNSIVLEEQRFLNSNLVIIAGILIVLFVVVLILFIDRQIRFRSTKMELERFWAQNDDQPVSEPEIKASTVKQEELDSLAEQNKAIKRKLEEMSNQKRVKESELYKEINSRKEMEKEIKLLISQIKERV